MACGGPPFWVCGKWADDIRWAVSRSSLPLIGRQESGLAYTTQGSSSTAKR